MRRGITNASSVDTGDNDRLAADAVCKSLGYIHGLSVDVEFRVRCGRHCIEFALGL